MKKKKVFIIGNGFDLDLGWKTNRGILQRVRFGGLVKIIRLLS